MRERLKLKKPVLPFVVTQHFGEDLTCVDSQTRTRCLTKGEHEACPDGYESLYRSAGMQGHNGLDFKAGDKQAVYAAIDGKVTRLEAERNRGIGIEIVSKRRYCVSANGASFYFKTRYWHLASYAVGLGQSITAGELIGWADTTGLSSGTHLHFELKPAKRRLWGKFRNLFPHNGYFGAIDPEPYFND